MKNSERQRDATIINILAHSFKDNKSVIDIIGTDKNNSRRLKYLMEYSLNVCKAYGRVILNDDHSACALVLFPDKVRLTWRYICWNLKLVFHVIGLWNLPRILKREALIKKCQANANIYYLWFIGVMPLKQNSGIGTSVLSALIADAGLKERPVYLETSTERNLKWYTNHGFECYDRLNLGYSLFLFRLNRQSK